MGPSRADPSADGGLRRTRGQLDIGFQDPDVNATIRVAPRRAFGLADEDLVGTATRWTFEA
jgi:hypothetical protein